MCAEGQVKGKLPYRVGPGARHTETWWLYTAVTKRTGSCGEGEPTREVGWWRGWGSLAAEVGPKRAVGGAVGKDLA